MNHTDQDIKPIKLLLDLKPALDGYAGIPQETRLLFWGLSTMQNYEIDGLIQHGSRKLKSAIAPNGNQTVNSRKINRLSRTVISLYEQPRGKSLEAAVDVVDRYFALTWLRVRAFFRVSIKPSFFQTGLFDDFIWRTFFNKTLSPSKKDLITSLNYRVLSYPRNLMHKAGLASRKFGTTPTYPRIKTKGFDFFIAQTPYPARVSSGTQLVVRYHDAVPVLMPHTISDKLFHQAAHFYALQENVNAGAWFACISESTRQDLLKIFPEVASRSLVIHNVVSDEYYVDDSPKALTQQIIRNRITGLKGYETNLSVFEQEHKLGGKPFDYLLMVSTIEPRKNHLLLLSAWERLKYTTMPNLKLVIVGTLGWDHAAIIEAFKPWAERGDLFLISNVPSSELRSLYKHASATICPSLAEGFDYSGIEAMRCGGVVMASDIPVHREIFQKASVYFNPYSSEDAAAVIQQTLSQEGAPIRKELRTHSSRVIELYTPKALLQKWDDLFSKKINKNKN